MNTQLDSFEARLLVELREHVSERTPADGVVEHPARRSARTWLALTAACAAVALTAVLVVPGLGSSPAYSVGEGNAGEINVKINRPEDAAGLELALESYGISADITYLPELQTCAPGRYQVVDRAHPGMMASIGERQISVTLPPDTVRDGEAFVLTWSVLPMTDEEMTQIAGSSGGLATDGFTASVEFDIATGPVAPCEPVAATT